MADNEDVVPTPDNEVIMEVPMELMRGCAGFGVDIGEFAMCIQSDKKSRVTAIKQMK